MGEAKRRTKPGAPSPQPQRSGQVLTIAGVAAVIALVIGAIYYVTRPPQPTSDALPVAADDAGPFPAEVDRYGISVGPEDADVVVREFADYQCPACGRFADASQRLKQEYVDSGKVRFVFFDLPLRQHGNAVPAAMAARCAGDQESYWPMHDRLFAQQSEWNSTSDPVGTFTRYAESLGLDARRFRRCMETDLHLDAIERSRQLARQLGITSTPTVLVDNIPLTQPGWGQLRAVVERELANAGE